MRDYKRLDDFLNQRLKDIYPEPFGEPALSIIRMMVPKIVSDYGLPAGSKVLDVGCGHGEALRAFKKEGMEAIGVGYGEEAVKCRDEGFQIVEEDMSFLSFAPESFDLVWCRHVLEHSLFPLFTLSEMCRLLKPGGIFYMEVPAPETACRHETNINHYSVLTRNSWFNLIHRSGFKDIKAHDLDVTVPIGPDKYFVYSAVK